MAINRKSRGEAYQLLHGHEAVNQSASDDNVTDAFAVEPDVSNSSGLQQSELGLPGQPATLLEKRFPETLLS